CRNLDPDDSNFVNQNVWVWTLPTPSRATCQVCQFIYDTVISIQPDLVSDPKISANVRLYPGQNRFYFNFFGLFCLQIYTKLGMFISFASRTRIDSCSQTNREPPVSNANSSIEFARRCLEDCQLNHPVCSQRSSRFQPSRLIYCPGTTEQLQLVETGRMADTAVPAEYVALSYCWGSDGFFKTTRATTDNLKQGFGLSLLPKTLQDAVKVTQQLGNEYIWIDALCIIQDDAADWEKESGKMAEVYGNARVTIAALSAASVTEGFLHLERNSELITRTWSDECGSTKLLAAKEGVRTGLHASSLDRDNPWPEVGSLDHYFDPVQTRGWCFQEEVLSRRFIAYSRKEVQWSCRTAMGCQCGPLDSKGNNNLRPRPQTLSLYSNPFGFWAEMISSYSHRDLSFGKDKLPAISGLAREVQRVTSAKYLAGIWLHDLTMSLSWLVPRVSQIKPYPSIYRAPSFSWASIDSPVSMDAQEYLRGLVSLVSWHVDPKGQDPLGEVKQARLTVRGFVHEAILMDSTDTVDGFEFNIRIVNRTTMVRNETDLVRFQIESPAGHEQWSARRAKEWEESEDDGEWGPDVTVWALCLGVDDEFEALEFLVLGQCPTDRTKLERIGFARLNSNDPQPDSDSDDSEAPPFDWKEYHDEITHERHRRTITLV
ncbi:heterokaryon incompatibility protein-domain-containing protein, partial [Apiosordaria backusii]